MAFSVTFVTNDEVCSRTWQPLLSDTVWSRRLPFFGHLIHASSCITRTTTKLLQAFTSRTAADRRRRPGCSGLEQSWLRISHGLEQWWLTGDH